MKYGFEDLFLFKFSQFDFKFKQKDEKAMTVIDVSGCGSGAVFLIKGKANLLFEAGMAYAADQMVENIKRESDDE